MCSPYHQGAGFQVLCSSKLFLGCFVDPVLQPFLLPLSPTCSFFSQEGGNSCTAP